MTFSNDITALQLADWHWSYSISDVRIPLFNALDTVIINFPIIITFIDNVEFALHSNRKYRNKTVTIKSNIKLLLRAVAIIWGIRIFPSSFIKASVNLKASLQNNCQYFLRVMLLLHVALFALAFTFMVRKSNQMERCHIQSKTYASSFLRTFLNLLRSHSTVDAVIFCFILGK